MAKKKEEEEVEEQEELVVNVGDGPEHTIDDLPGVGPATAEKLREAGFDDLMAIAVMNPADLADQAELVEDKWLIFNHFEWHSVQKTNPNSLRINVGVDFNTLSAQDISNLFSEK